MWGLAHEQGIKLPGRPTGSSGIGHPGLRSGIRRSRTTCPLFHWTELIQSSPLAVERTVYEIIGKEYRGSNVTTMELRFNPMKRNRAGERDLDHIIDATLRGHGPRLPGVPREAGLIFCLAREFTARAQRDHRREGRHVRRRGVVGIDLAGTEAPDFRPADYARLFRHCRRKGLGITVHTGKSGAVEEIAEVIEHLEPSRIGHGVKAAYDPRTMALIRERGITLEVCPTSNLNSRVVSGWDELRWILDTFRSNQVRFTINTDGPGSTSRPTSATSWPRWGASGSSPWRSSSGRSSGPERGVVRRRDEQLAASPPHAGPPCAGRAGGGLTDRGGLDRCSGYFVTGLPRRPTLSLASPARDEGVHRVDAVVV